MEKKTLFNRVASFALALVMVVSTLVVADATTVKAADFSMKGTGTQTVAITDETIYNDYLAGQNYQYISFKPKKTGYVTVRVTSINPASTQGYIALCKANKSLLSANEIYTTGVSDSAAYTMTFGVKKGTTYNLRVYANNGVNVKATFKKQDKSKANKKSKAKTIKAGKTYKGVILAGENKADWYKIKLTKSKKVKLSYSAKANGTGYTDGIKISFLKSNGKKFVSNAYDNVNRIAPKNAMEFYRRYTLSGRTTGIEKGTYYVKVERAAKTTSGYYEIKWK